MKDDLLVKYLLDEITIEEWFTVGKWLGEKRTHVKRFKQIRLIWEIAGKHRPEDTIDENMAWIKFKIITIKQSK